MTTVPTPYDDIRDRRRRLSIADRRILFDRANGRCQRCDAPLDVDWHAAHLLAHAHGGATTLSNMQAWCAPCNLKLGATDMPTPKLELRRWQADALPDILLRLFERGRATLHAAPGAGKTIFGGTIYGHLCDVGLIERLLVIVPNRVLVGQWRDSLATHLGLFLDDNPRDGFWEHPETVGCIVTYANLANAARQHRHRLEASPTLVIFDEVHHLADRKSWGRAALAMIGSGDDVVAPVLNTTGTLFRSTGRERIPTVDYREAVDEHGTPILEAIADVSVTADVLLGEELRPVDLHACGSTIELVDLREEEVITGEVADLSNRKLMRAAHSHMIREPEWMRGFAVHMWERLRLQSKAIGHAEPLKALWVASDQKTARIAAKIIDEVVQVEGFARLVISDEPSALRTLRQAVSDDHPCCIVAVQMVTEGFDCPQVSTIAYAHNFTSELYLTQMVARAMRLTPAERHIGRVLPAQVLIPDVPDLRRAFASVLVSKLHTLALEQDDLESDATGRSTDGVERLPRFDLTMVSPPRPADIDVLGETDGIVDRSEHDVMAGILDGLGVPTVYAPRMVVAGRRFSEERVLRGRPAGTVSTGPAHPRDINKAWRARSTQRANWWTRFGDTDIQNFQAEANRAADIPPGGRASATGEQLARVVSFMNACIRTRCDELDMDLPHWLEELD